MSSRMPLQSCYVILERKKENRPLASKFTAAYLYVINSFGVPNHSELEPDCFLATRDGNAAQSSGLDLVPSPSGRSSSSGLIPHWIGILIS